MNFAVFLACRKLPLVIGKRPEILSAEVRQRRRELKDPLHAWHNPLEGFNRGIQPRAGVLGSLSATAWRWRGFGGFGVSLARPVLPAAVLIQPPGYLR